jgi:hypothetical protein
MDEVSEKQRADKDTRRNRPANRPANRRGKGGSGAQSNKNKDLSEAGPMFLDVGCCFCGV